MKTASHWVLIKFSKTQKIHVGSLEEGNLFRVVPSMLNLAKVSAAEHKLAQTALADPTSNGLRQGSIEQHAMPGVVLALGAFAQL
jgi:hypothetical protein